MFRALIIGLSLMTFVAPASASGPAAKKPSEIVTLRTSGSGTGCNSNDHIAFDEVAFGQQPFTIPSGFVLLVSDVTFVATGADTLQLQLNDDVPTNSTIAYLPITNTSGSTQMGALHFDTPLVVRSGQTLCIGQPTAPTTLSATLVGTLTKDK